MRKGYVCCFTGHRSIESIDIDILHTVLGDILEKMIKNGVTVFRSGGAYGFDICAALEVIEKRKKYPFVQLHLYLPCKEQTLNWDGRDKEIYLKMLDNADKIIYTSEEYSAGCMHHGDRCLVDGADVCVAYCKKSKGGTAYTLNYAKEKRLAILNIAQSADIKKG